MILMLFLSVPAGAQTPNPTNFRVVPAAIVIPGNLYFCADQAVGVTADIRGIWTQDGVDTPFEGLRAIMFDSEGCADKYYTNENDRGTYQFTEIRNSDNGPSGPWTSIIPAVVVTLRLRVSNPSSFRTDPTDPLPDITIPGSIRYCAGDAPGMTLDVRGTWAHDDVEDVFEVFGGVALEADGCKTVSYTDMSVAGIYTLREVRNAANGPNGPWVTVNPPVRVTLRRTPAGPPTITAISQEVIQGEQDTLVTVTGTNFLDSDVSIIQDKVGRQYPTITFTQVNFEGTEVQVRIDASHPDVLHYYTLVVSNSRGQGYVQFRVIPKSRARWDVMTPDSPSIWFH